jgi:hypothetical protein
MKKLAVLFLLLTFTITVFLLNCSKDDNSKQNPTGPDTTHQDTNKIVIDTPKVVGNWEGSMVAVPPYLNDQVNVSVIVKMDSTFRLSTAYATSNITTLIDSGHWTISSDTIFLNGDNCSIYDTTLKILKPLESCGEPAKIKIDINSTTLAWRIPLSSLTPLSAAFNINLSNPLIALAISKFSIDVYKK